MTNEQDFLCDTILHVTEVQENLEVVASQLRQRGYAHDRTKFQALEFDAFVSTRDAFKKANYGTPEYQVCVDAVKPAVDHHYENNRHHTGFHAGGFADMDLIDVIEMLCDWRAAARRSPNRTLADTLQDAFKKYNIGEEMQEKIIHTLTNLEWIEY